MKRIIALLLVFIIAGSFAACSDTNSQSSTTNATISASSSDKNEIGENQAQSSDESQDFVPDNETGDMTTATQIIGDEQSGELPEIEGPDMFVELFSKNPIDAYYVDNMELASSVSNMLNITNDTMRYWEAEVNSVYSKLSELLGESSVEFNEIAIEQKAFVNDLAIAADEIKNEIGEAAEGSMINIEISYRLMLLYRGRAVELLCRAYNITGEVDIQLITDAAG